MLNFERCYDDLTVSKSAEDLCRELPSKFSMILTWTTNDEMKKKVEVDCDVFAVFLSDEAFSGDRSDIVYFARTVHPSGSVSFFEDSQYKKRLEFDLEKIPNQYDQIVLGVNIYEGKKRNQSFLNVQDACVKVLAFNTFSEIKSFDLTLQDFCDKTSIYLADLKKNNAKWELNPVEIGSADVVYIEDFAKQFVNI